jgi:septal ring factor EnvC (AmiA/AmiB activator)
MYAGKHRRSARAKWLLVASIVVCAVGAHAQADPPQAAEATRTEQEAQAKQKLEQVRAEIHRVTDEQRTTATQRNDVTADLRTQELKIAATAKELRALDQKLVAQQARLDQLVVRRDALETSLKTQREALAALLRSAYALGRNEELRLLLMQDDVDSISRLLAYYRYFERARIGEIDHLLKDLEALAQVQQSIEQETGQIRQSREAREEEARQLNAQRDERRQVLATLETNLKDQQSRLAALGKDEKGLLALLEKLRDIFADIPKQIAGAEPFAQMRGRLSWPLKGTARTGAGEEGDSHGVLIAAAEGGEVRAVSHGRVVFADWLWPAADRRSRRHVPEPVRVQRNAAQGRRRLGGCRRSGRYQRRQRRPQDAGAVFRVASRRQTDGRARLVAAAFTSALTPQVL